jgi:patatin-like phospholipase/acyl hydrolase
MDDHPAARPLRKDLAPRGRDLVAVLAIDGGGMRGLLAARVLEALEARAGLPVSALFDLVAGTSTGAILALGLVAPAADRAGPRFAASDLVALYRTHGRDIFGRSLLQRIRSLGGLAGPKHDPRAHERVLRQYLGDARLSDALVPVLVTAYDTAAAQPYLFKSYREPRPDGTPVDDELMWQAARASSAAPTYFPPFALAPADGGAERSLVDGGVYANNPAMCALADAYKLFGGGRSRYLVVSIGTGNDEIRLAHRAVAGRGLLGWARPLLKIVFDGASDTVDYQTAEMADRYCRLQDDAVEGDLDDASDAAIAHLLAAGDALVARRAADLQEVADLLRANAAAALPRRGSPGA